MNLSEALQAVKAQALAFEEQRRLLLRTAVEAHVDHGLGANTIATNLGAYAGGPGWGRDRVLAYLAAARTARAANDAFRRVNLVKIVQAFATEPRSADVIPLEVPDTVARLAVLTGGRLGVQGAKAVLSALNTAGLTVDAADAEAALAESSKATVALVLKPIPRPLIHHENGDDTMSTFGGDGTPGRAGRAPHERLPRAARGPGVLRPAQSVP